jgi:hypothetical protein
MIVDLLADLPTWLATEHAALATRRDELIDDASTVPAEIADDEALKKASDLVKTLLAGSKAAEGARVAAKEPMLGAGRLVDGFFRAIIDPLDSEKRRIETRMTIYQRKVAEAERRHREDEARLARAEADRREQEAAAQEASLRTAADLDGAITAAALARQAAADADRAQKAGQAKAAEMSRSRSDLGAVASLHTFWDWRDLYRDQLDLEALRSHLPLDALEKAVRSFIKAGGRQLRGVTIYENTQTKVR